MFQIKFRSYRDTSSFTNSSLNPLVPAPARSNTNSSYYLFVSLPSRPIVQYVRYRPVPCVGNAVRNEVKVEPDRTRTKTFQKLSHLPHLHVTHTRESHQARLGESMKLATVIFVCVLICLYSALKLCVLFMRLTSVIYYYYSVKIQNKTMLAC